MQEVDILMKIEIGATPKMYSLPAWRQHWLQYNWISFLQQNTALHSE